MVYTTLTAVKQCPHYLSRNSDICWEIISEHPRATLEITIDEMQIEWSRNCINDYLMIIDGEWQDLVDAECYLQISRAFYRTPIQNTS